MSELEQALTDDGLAFEIDPSDHAPPYVQIARQIRIAVADGSLQPGAQLPPVREAARRLKISPNTVGRAYSELSREGVIAARAGGGSVIASADRLDNAALQRARQERLKTLARLDNGCLINIRPLLEPPVSVVGDQAQDSHDPARRVAQTGDRPVKAESRQHCGHRSGDAECMQLSHCSPNHPGPKSPSLKYPSVRPNRTQPERKRASASWQEKGF